jgi:hypothetical protein
MSPEPSISHNQLSRRNALGALPPGNSLDMVVEPPVSPDQLFCHNASEKLPPADLDLEKQCAGPGETKPTWWRQIWGRILSLIFKTEASTVLSGAGSDLSSTPNTSVHSNRPTIKSVRETDLVERVATCTGGLMRAKLDSQSIPTFEETIRVHSPAPSPPPVESRQDDLLNDRELDDLILLIQDASSPPMSSSVRSTAREGESTAIPPSLHHSHPDVCGWNVDR